MNSEFDVAGIIGDIWISDAGYRNLRTLCSFGNRFGGTSSEIKARDFILGRFQEYGLDKVCAEEFEYLGWRHFDAECSVVHPVERKMTSAPYAYSGSTHDEGVEGEVVFLGHNLPSSFDMKKDNIAGKIPMVIHAIAPGTTRVVPNPIDATNRAIEYGAKALMMMTEKYGGLPQVDECQVEKASQIPVIGITSEDGQYIKRLLREGKVSVRIKTRNKTERMKSWNVMGELTGTEKPREQLIAGAHFDSFYVGEEGALDDAAGACVVMELARVLAKHKRNFKRTVKFICFPLEEIGSIGSYRYAAKHAQELKNAILMLNLDEAASPGTKKYLLDDPRLVQYVREIVDELGFEEMQVATEYDLPGGDEAPFLYAGVPTLWMRLGPPFVPDIDGRYSHTAQDTVDKINQRDMREATMLAAYTLLNYVNIQEPAAKKRTVEEIRSVLDKEGYIDCLRKDGRWEFVEKTFLSQA
jgi:carboxypeptidase Q